MQSRAVMYSNVQLCVVRLKISKVEDTQICLKTQ